MRTELRFRNFFVFLNFALSALLFGGVCGEHFTCPGGESVDTTLEAQKCVEKPWFKDKIQLCLHDYTKGCVQHGEAYYCCRIHCDDDKKTPVDVTKDWGVANINVICSDESKEFQEVSQFPLYNSLNMAFCCPKESTSSSSSSSSSDEKPQVHFKDHQISGGAHPLAHCVDHEYCGTWAKNGFCDPHHVFYTLEDQAAHCPLTCGVGCGHPQARAAERLHQMQWALARQHALVARDQHLLTAEHGQGVGAEDTHQQTHLASNL